MHQDLLLRLHTLNNWDKHRRLTFSFLVPQGVSGAGDGEELAVVDRPGELAGLRGISWLGLDKPMKAVNLNDIDFDAWDPSELSDTVIEVTDPDVLADMRAQIERTDYDFHFSWWPLATGDEIGRYIPHPACRPVPDMRVGASLRLVLFEPDLFDRGHVMATSADRLLAEIIDEVETVVAILRGSEPQRDP